MRKPCHKTKSSRPVLRINALFDADADMSLVLIPSRPYSASSSDDMLLSNLIDDEEIFPFFFDDTIVQTGGGGLTPYDWNTPADDATPNHTGSTFLVAPDDDSPTAANHRWSSDVPNPLASSLDMLLTSSVVVADSGSVVSADSFLLSDMPRSSPPVDSSPTKKKGRPASQVNLSRRPTKKRRGSTTTKKQGGEIRARNRQHAKSSRHRKKVFTTSLQDFLAELKAENEKLRSHIMERMGSQKTETLIKEKQPVRPVERLIASLKEPENRGLDDTTIDYLQSLRKNALIAQKTREEHAAFLKRTPLVGVGAELTSCHDLVLVAI
jgi:hypothetical protein